MGTEQRMTRRRFLDLVWKTACAATFGPVLAACGPKPSTETPDLTATKASTATAEPTQAATATATATEEPTKTSEPTDTPEPTATLSPEGEVARSLGLPENGNRFQVMRGIRHLVDGNGSIVAVEGWDKTRVTNVLGYERVVDGGPREWTNLAELRSGLLEYLKNRERPQYIKETGMVGSLDEGGDGALYLTGATAGTSVRSLEQVKIDLGDKGVVHQIESMPFYFVDEDGVLRVAWIGLGFKWEDPEGNWVYFDDASHSIISIDRMSDAEYGDWRLSAVIEVYGPGDLFQAAMFANGPTAVGEASAPLLRPVYSAFIRAVTPRSLEFGPGAYGVIEGMETVYPLMKMSVLGRRGRIAGVSR